MRAFFLLMMFLSLGNLLSAQINYGVNIGTGFNKELIYNYRNKIDITSYKVSYKAGVWTDYIFFKRIGINVELNYFRKNTKLAQYDFFYNYIETPFYLSIKVKKMNFLLGMSNNFNIKVEGLQRLYTISFIGGISCSVLKKFDIKFWYNRELDSHNILLEPNDKYTPKYFHQNYMLSVYFKFK